ncbi:hypothetical protein ONZ51_g7159 [Trametes cubensis]|uniref:CN hydrolase domain-containing protein n=1 Tax=Trametes cubensis TaxID=1111947 RepID=A0AAD7TT79_9APHY|nr:hypothetical protein ONZ51_g7159 [Trametes cubensis]
MSLASLPIRYPSRVYLSIAPVLALGALAPTPSFTPLVLLVAILRLHFDTIIPRRAWASAVFQIILVSLATGLVNAAPSLHALSTPTTSLFVLAFLSLLATTVAAGTITAGNLIERAVNTPWTHATIFPATWATAWALVERGSPVGQLATWSPVINLGGYSWLRQVGGQVAINWIVAAWAVIISDVVGQWMMGSAEETKSVSTEDLLSDDLPVQRTISPAPSAISTRTRRTLLMTAFLFGLAAPSYVFTELPPPVNAPDVTPFGVACAMPYRQKNGQPRGPPSLDDYVSESHTLQSQAKIILWPESAVHFTQEGEREGALEKIRPYINNGTYYGIGFEEVVHADSPDGVWKRGMRRNGLVLLGWEGVVYEYYKRNLVPSKLVPATCRMFFLTLSFAPLSRRIILDDTLKREAIHLHHGTPCAIGVDQALVEPSRQSYAPDRHNCLHLLGLHHRFFLCRPPLASRAHPRPRTHLALQHRARDVGTGKSACRGDR